jgi:hypothetical protein
MAHLLEVTMDLNRFDRVLWRFNGLVFALICAVGLILAVLAIVGLCMSNPSSIMTIASQPKEQEKQKEKPKLTLSHFCLIRGTSFISAGLYSETENRSKSYSASSSGCFSGSESSDDAPRNYLFLDANTLNSHWLASNNNSRFIWGQELLEDPSASAEKSKTIAFIYETVPFHEGDSSQDGNAKERESILFYNLAAGKLKTLVNNISDLLAVEQVTKDRTLVLYKDNDKKYVLAIKTSTIAFGNRGALGAL